MFMFTSPNVSVWQTGAQRSISCFHRLLINWGRSRRHITKTDSVSTARPLGPTTDPCWAAGRGSLLDMETYCSPKLVCDSNCPVSPLLRVVLVYPNWNQPPLIRWGCKWWLSWGLGASEATVATTHWSGWRPLIHEGKKALRHQA